ncbi:hypothetical protein FI667_g16208, partial [Globisporangium splendens]
MKISSLTTFVCVAALAVGAMAHSDDATPAPASTVKTASTPSTAANQTTPATTTKAPSTTPVATTKAPTSTPASTTKAPSTTPATTTKATNTPTTITASKCINVSVEGDATYCITGPICSGGGKEPAGKNCPKKGDVAVESCLKTLKSYTDAGKCVAPSDAECVAVKTGVWGCAWPTTKTVTVTPAVATKAPSATPATTTKAPTSTPSTTTKAPSATSASSTKAPSTTPATTTKATSATPASTTAQKVSLLAESGDATGPTTGTVAAAVAATAGVAAGVVGAVLYKKNKKATKEVDDMVAIHTP